MRISDWSSDVCSSDLDDVGGVLEADRKAQQAVADAECGAILRLQTLVRRRRRMGDEALGVAEIVGDVDKAKRVHHATRARLSAGHLEGPTRAAALHLAPPPARPRAAPHAPVGTPG